VLDEHEGHPAVGWHVGEKLGERLKAARGRADADDQRGLLRRWGGWGCFLTRRLLSRARFATGTFAGPGLLLPRHLLALSFDSRDVTSTVRRRNDCKFTRAHGAHCEGREPEPIAALSAP